MAADEGTVVVTPAQFEVLSALDEHGTMAEAVAAHGATRAAYDHRLRKVRSRTGLTTYQLMRRLGSGDVVVQATIWPDAERRD